MKPIDINLISTLDVQGTSRDQGKGNREAQFSNLLACKDGVGRGFARRGALCAGEVLLLAAALGSVGVGTLRAATVVWSSATGSAWLTNTNWTGNTVPGVNDIAEFDNNPSTGGAAKGVGVNYGNPVNNGTFAGASGTLGDQAVGATIVTASRTNTLFIGNTKSAGSGYMTLNGAVFNGQSGTILSNASSFELTIQNEVEGATGTTFGLVLGNTGSYVQTAAGSSILISSTIDQVNSGSSITLQGNGTSTTTAGILELAGADSFTGGITVGNSDGSQGGEVQIDTTAALPTTGAMLVNNNSELLLYTSTGTSNNTYGGTGQSLTLNGAGTKANSGALRVDSGGVLNAIWQGTTTLGSVAKITVTSGNSLTLKGNVSDGGFQLQKQGGGVLTLSGTANNLTGTALVGNGTLNLANASGPAVSSSTYAFSVATTGTLLMGGNNQLNGGVGVTLTGATGTGAAATIGVGGFSQGSKSASGVGALTLASGSTNDVINFGNAAGVITFASLTTNSTTLTISNYVSNNGTYGQSDQLIFNQDEINNLSDIVFTGFGAATEQLVSGTAGTSGAFYEVFPASVPEPATLLGGSLMVGLLVWNQRRRFRGLGIPSIAG